MSQRHIKRLRRNRGEIESSRSGRTSQISQHSPSHHDERVIVHHAEPILKDIARQAASHHKTAETQHAPEVTIFDATIADTPLMAKVKTVNNMVATVQAGKNGGFKFIPYGGDGNHELSKSETPPEFESYQLTPVVDTLGHHLTIIGSYTHIESQGRSDYILHHASLAAVQIRPEGILVIEDLLTIDFSKETYTLNRDRKANHQHLNLTSGLLQGMHDHLVLNQQAAEQ